jgi:hypothetical protein
MQQKRFRSQFVHRQSEKARYENTDARNEAGRCRYGDNFSHNLFHQAYASCPIGAVRSPYSLAVVGRMRVPKAWMHCTNGKDRIKTEDGELNSPLQGKPSRNNLVPFCV